MSEDFQKLKTRIETLLQSQKPTGETRKTAPEVIMAGFLNTWELCEKDGLTTPDIFINLLSVMEENMAMQYRDLDGLKAYGQATKDRGSAIMRFVSDVWPPIDNSLWPDGWLERYSIKSK